MAGHRRPVEALHRIPVFASEHSIGDDHAEMGRQLRAMASITHRIPQPVLIARAREAVAGHVDESTPAIVDLYAGELREDSRETVDEDGAALCVGALIRCRREARPSAEY